MVALLGIYPEKTRIWKDTFIPSVHYRTVYNTQDTEATYFYIDELMKMMWYWYKMKYSVQFSSVAQSCPTLCDLWIVARPGLPVHHQLPEFTQTHVHRVSDAIQPSHPLSSPSPSAPNPSQHQSLPMSQLLEWGGQGIGVSALASFPPKNTHGWSPSEWAGWISLQSKGLSRVLSNTTVQKHQLFGTQLYSQSNSQIHTWLLEKP